MRIIGGGDAVTHGDGDRVRRLRRLAGHDPRRGGVLVAGVFETAVGDQHDPAEIHLVALGLGASMAARGAVFVDVCLVAAVGARTFQGSCRPGDGDPANRPHNAPQLSQNRSAGTTPHRTAGTSPPHRS